MKYQWFAPQIYWIATLHKRSYNCLGLYNGDLLLKDHIFCRYHSLCAYMGDDDMFSSDLSDDQLKQRLGHMANTPCQVSTFFTSYFPKSTFLIAFNYCHLSAWAITFSFVLRWLIFVRAKIRGGKYLIITSESNGSLLHYNELSAW